MKNIWNKYKRDINNNYFHANHNFDELILALLFLYSVNVITEEKGEILRCI